MISLPLPLINHLEHASEVFGGVEAVPAILPEEQIAYIAAFPGALFVTAPWLIRNESSRVDLRQSGYSGGGYKVFNRNFDYIYSGNSSMFGDSQADRDLVSRAYHGEYFHLQYDSDKGKALSLLWVAKQPSPQQKNYILDQYRRIDANRTVADKHEIILETYSLLPKHGNVLVFYVEGNWELGLTGEQIEDRASGAAASIEPGWTVRLTPRANTWYAMRQAERDDYLIVKDLVGNQPLRWREGVDGYYFQASSEYTGFRSPKAYLNVDYAGRQLVGTSKAVLSGQLRVNTDRPTVEYTDARLLTETGDQLTTETGDLLVL